MSLPMCLLLVDGLLAFLQLMPLHAAPGVGDSEAPKPISIITIDKVTPEQKKGFLQLVECLWLHKMNEFIHQAQWRVPSQ